MSSVSSSAPITIQGVGTGLPVNSWINALVQADSQPLNNLNTQLSKTQVEQSTMGTVGAEFSALQAAVQNFTDGNIASNFDLFKQNSATSSDSSAITATADDTASTQSVSVKIGNLATATQAVSNTNIAQTVTGNEQITTLGNNTGTSGTFSYYANVSKYKISINSGNTLNDVIGEINQNSDESGVSASLSNDGKLTFTANSGANLVLGSNNDTSNFFDVTQISTAHLNGNSYTSVDSLNQVNTNGAILSTANLTNGSDITSGSFTIGNAVFKIDQNTTLNDIIGQINTSTSAGVTAQYNSNTNKLTLTSKTPGKVPINMQAGDANGDNASNFLTKMGLISDSGDSLASQTLGQNAIIYINGSSTPVESASNVVKGNVSGITGLTMNLLSLPSTNTVNIKVSPSTDQIVSAVNNFISSFNTAINDVNSQTASNGTLQSEDELSMLGSDMQNQLSNPVSGLSTYNTLASIGISTGDPGANVNANTTDLTLDQNKLLSALQANPYEVRTLLMGDSSKGITGLFQTFGNQLNGITDPINGLFAAADQGFNSQISTLNNSNKILCSSRKNPMYADFFKKLTNKAV